MAHYKGIEVADDLAGLIRHMDSIDATRETLVSLQSRWDMLALLSEMSGTGVDIAGVRSSFEALTAQLVGRLARETERKSGQELVAKAQVAIDILVRNLFERTADIGFLATDAALRQFAQADAGTRNAERPAIVERLREYQRKYSVYRDIVLLAPNGEVLVRLDGTVHVAASADPLVRDALASQAPYLEVHRHWDARPADARSLVYACRMTAAANGQPIAVLCLCFDFDDECRRIFDGLLTADDWTALAVIDGEGRVLASSDLTQLPADASLGKPPHRAPRTVRFAGRQWLACACDATPYQGYAGPGWRGQAMLPLDQAFAQTGAQATALSPQDVTALGRSPKLFSAELREIPRAAQRIEAALTRAVWNGNVALGAVPTTAGPGGDEGHGFAKTLLREINRTGARTRDVFTRAIGDMNETVLSSTLSAAAARAALAIDILDRNLYERANDCRWWALTPDFRSALQAPQVDGATQRALTGILQTIHGLYTVYANLLLFDRHGKIVAVSREDAQAVPGQRIDAEWAERVRVLQGSQAYVVSAFEPSGYYEGRHTLVYAAAVHGPNASTGAPVGGIAIVFDAAPQFDAMLADTAPRDAEGRVLPGSVGLFVDGSQRVVASTRPDIAVGSTLPLTLPGSGADGGRGAAGLVRWDGNTYAVGTCRDGGYREYAGRHGARHPPALLAVSMALLADSNDVLTTAAALPPPLPQTRHTAGLGHGAPAAARLELATFAVGGQWYGVQSHEVQEAVAAEDILPLPGASSQLRGSVMLHGEAIAVLDLAVLLGNGRSVPTAASQIVIVRPAAQRQRFGLLVDALGDNPDVARAQLDRAGAFVGGAGALVEHLIRPAPDAPAGQHILPLLSVERLQAVLGQARSSGRA